MCHSGSADNSPQRGGLGKISHHGSKNPTRYSDGVRVRSGRRLPGSGHAVCDGRQENQTQMADLILDVSGLTVRFGKTTVLHDVTFQVERGASLAILGPNASGKT